MRISIRVYLEVKNPFLADALEQREDDPRGREM